MKLPGPGVEEAAKSLNRDDLMIIKQGTPVRLFVQAGQDTARVQAALVKKIHDNGWVPDANAAVVITAEMKRGETQNITYQMFGGRSTGSRQTASVTPFISSLKIEVGDKVAWQSATSSGAPPTVRLKESESVQSEVNRWQRPNPEFFERVEIPAQILDPAKKNGLGVTEVSNRGLVPK